MDSLAGPKPIAPLQRHLQLETDFFCHACGYNLHGQVVTRDERLGFLICRCPECGTFHPAAMGVSASRPWLARLGVSIVASWVVLSLLVVGLGGLFLGAAVNAHLQTYTERDSNGRFTYRRVAAPDPAAIGVHYYERWQSFWVDYVLSDTLLSIALGMFTAITAWHLSRLRQFLFLLVPIIVSAIVFWSVMLSSDDNSLVFAYAVRIVFLYTVLSVAMIVFGQFVGRPIARFFLRLLVPPRLRQHVNFLWIRDGKSPPSVAA